MMEDVYVNWEDVDLDDVLGANNWTDDEIEWISSDSDVTPESENLPPSLPEKENNITAATGSESSSTQKKIYKCPLCEKIYTSTSGFRGHVSKKHERPDIKAYMHRTDAPEDDTRTKNQMPKQIVPLSSAEELQKEVASITEDSLNEIYNDKFHSRPSSRHGQTLIRISQQILTANLAILHLLLITSISPIFSSKCDYTSSRFLQQINKLHSDPKFIDAMLDFIFTNVDFNLELRFANMFLHRFLTCFTNSYLKRQLQLLKTQQKCDIAAVSKNDKQVLHYICGYILHALKKRYLKAKVKNTQLLNLLDHIYTTDEEKSSDSTWTDLLDRGGLKRPSNKFFQLMIQVERWVREIVNVTNLHSNSLVELKEKLCDYGLLRSSWDRMIVDIDNKKWLMLDHVVALFVKVRGFAVTKLVRKQLQKKRKDAKVTAGSRKALRKELRNLSN